MTAILIGFNVVLPLKHFLYDKTLKPLKVILFLIFSVVSVTAFWLVFGLLNFKKSTNLDVGNIYGAYSFNLNSFFNSYGHYSKFIPHLGMVTDQQYEGFAYLV